MMREIWWAVLYYWDMSIEVCERLIYWTPIVIRDRDFDYQFTLMILRHKLLRLQKNLRQDRNDYTVDEIQQAIELLDKSMGQHPDYKITYDITITEYDNIQEKRKAAGRLFWEHVSKHINQWWT